VLARSVGADRTIISNRPPPAIERVLAPTRLLVFAAAAQRSTMISKALALGEEGFLPCDADHRGAA